MKYLVLVGIIFFSVNYSIGNSISGSYLERNGLDSSSKHLLFSVHVNSCKNCIYFNKDILFRAKNKGYKVSFVISNLVKEDIEDFKKDDEFIAKYNIITDDELSSILGSSTISIITNKNIEISTDCSSTHLLENFFLKKENTKLNERHIDSVLLDTSYNFNSGSVAYLSNNYCVIMDMRYNRKVHKLDINTGKIVAQLKLDNKQWCKNIYSVIYDNDGIKIQKSLKAREVFIRGERLFGNQEFRPDNIVVKEGKTYLSLTLSYPFFNGVSDDTIMKETTVIFQLNNDLTIKDYWVAPIDELPTGFNMLWNSNMTPTYFSSNNVILPVYYNYEGFTAHKYTHAKFSLENHKIVFKSYLPFEVPKDKSDILGDYNVASMYIVENNVNLIGSYITFPAIYNLSQNQKITDIERIGLSSHKNGKIDSLLFTKELRGLQFLITYFERYNDKYYVVQAKNGSWNTYQLLDNKFKPVKTIYASKDKKEPKLFYAKDGKLYTVKFGETDKFYIYKHNMSNFFDMELD